MGEYTFWANLSDIYSFKTNLCLFCSLAHSTYYALKAVNEENVLLIQRTLKDPL